MTVGSAEIFPPSVGCSERKDANNDGGQRIDGEELVQMRPCRLHYGALRLREAVKRCLLALERESRREEVVALGRGERMKEQKKAAQ